MQYNGQEKEIKLGLSSKILCSKEYKRWKQAAADLQVETSKKYDLETQLGELALRAKDLAAAVKDKESSQTPEERADAIPLSGGGMFDCKKSTAEATNMQQKAEAMKSGNEETARKIAKAVSEVATLSAKLRVLRSGVHGILKPPGAAASGNAVTHGEFTHADDLNLYGPVHLPDYMVDFNRKTKPTKAAAAARRAADLKNIRETKEKIQNEIPQYPADYSDTIFNADPVIDEGEEESALIPAVREQSHDFSDELYVTYYDDAKNNFVHMAVPNGSKGDKVRKNKTELQLLPFTGIPVELEDGDLMVPALGGAKKRASKKPSAKKPAAKKPAAKKTAAKKPAAKKPAAKKPASKKPAAKKPAAKKPAAKKPAAKKPAAKK